MLLPSRDSAVGRGVATAIQVGIAVVGLLPIVAALIADPRFAGLIHDYLPQLTGTVAGLSGFVSFLNNLLRKEVPNV